MSIPYPRLGLMALSIGLLVASMAPRAASQGDPAAEPAKGDPAAAPADGDPAPADPKAPPKDAPVSGFVQVPAGQVWPGCTEKDYKERHRGNSDLKKVLAYDIWGDVPAFPLGGFEIGRYEVTNAQWKHYLDTEFRVEHTTQKGETLKSLASQFVKFRDTSIESEWKAIYAINWNVIVDGWQKAGVWQAGWPVETPPSAPGNSVEGLELPEGLKLVLYKTRIPQHWYGWCRLSGLGIGREYYDPSKPAAQAFTVPEGEPFKSLALADTDFSAYPVRSVSPIDMLAFAEWAGCQLPTEYEWERAARGDDLRAPYAFGKWDPNKQKTILAGPDNERCKLGTLRVDDPSVSGSDSPFGARHMHGNVWEQTRTWFDVHPRQAIEPPSPPDANYTLVVKGGSFGDRWQFLMVCARTGSFGEAAELSLRDNHRVDSVGLRLVRHAERPGYDLMLHSIRRLSYNAAASQWSTYPPHAFAMERIVGTDDVTLVPSAAPYVHAVKRAHGIAVAPLWVTTMSDGAKRESKPERNRYQVLGAFRSDVPLKAGVCLTDAEVRKITADRELYKKYMEEFKKLKPDKQKLVRDQLPKEPPPPDDYEKATEKNKDVLGLFRENTVPAGEWFVVHWNGFLGLVNPNFTMPPDAILLIDPKQITRKNEQPKPSQVTLDAQKGEIRFRFQTWEQPSEKSKQVILPGTDHSDQWALFEAYPAFFIKGGGGARPYCWDVDVAFKVASTDDPVWKSLTSVAPLRTPDKPPEEKTPDEDKKPSGK